jgi:hypothetical protein
MLFHHKYKETECYVLYFVSQDEVMKWTEEVGNVSLKEAFPNGPHGEVSCNAFNCCVHNSGIHMLYELC